MFDVNEDGTNELILCMIVWEDNMYKTLVINRNPNTGRGVLAGVRVLTDPRYQNPQWNDYFLADVNGDGRKEFIVSGVTTHDPHRYLFQTWDLKNRQHLYTTRAFPDAMYYGTNPALKKYLPADINADGKDEILCVGETNDSPARTFCTVLDPTDPNTSSSFEMLSSVRYRSPELSHFLTGNVDSVAGDELVTVGVATYATAPQKRTIVTVYDPNTGALKNYGFAVLSDISFAYPESNRYLLADGDGDGKKELIAIGITSHTPARTYLTRYDLETGEIIGSALQMLNSPLFEDPSLNEYFAWDLNEDGLDEVVAVGYVRKYKAHYMQAWKLNPYQRLGFFRVLDDPAYTHPAFNFWTGG